MTCVIITDKIWAAASVIPLGVNITVLLLNNNNHLLVAKYFHCFNGWTKYGGYIPTKNSGLCNFLSRYTTSLDYIFLQNVSKPHGPRPIYDRLDGDCSIANLMFHAAILTLCANKRTLNFSEVVGRGHIVEHMPTLLHQHNEKPLLWVRPKLPFSGRL